MAQYNVHGSGVNDDGHLPSIYITSDLQRTSMIDINPPNVTGDSDSSYHIGHPQFLGVGCSQYDSSGPSSPRSLYSESRENADWENSCLSPPFNEFYPRLSDSSHLVFENSGNVAAETLYHSNYNSNEAYISGPEDDLGMRLINIQDNDRCLGSLHNDDMLFDPGYLTYTFPTPLTRDDNPLSPNQSLPALSPNIGCRRATIEGGCFTPFSPDLGTSSQRSCAVEDYQRHSRYDASSRRSSPYPTTNHMNARRRHIHAPSRSIDSQDFGHSDSSSDITTPPPDMKLVVATDAIKTANEGRRIHPARFTCGICSQNFTTRHSRARHISSHLGQRPYKCTLCGQAFTNKTDCRRHEKSKKRHQVPPC